MKAPLFCALLAVALAGGCSHHKSYGGAGEGEHNVLVGGPVTGTRLSDLPQSVRDTLSRSVPTAEVADIDRQTITGRVIYKISFADPGQNPAMYISQDGKIVTDISNHKWFNYGH